MPLIAGFGMLIHTKSRRTTNIGISRHIRNGICLFLKVLFQIAGYRWLPQHGCVGGDGYRM